MIVPEASILKTVPAPLDDMKEERLVRRKAQAPGSGQLAPAEDLAAKAQVQRGGVESRAVAARTGGRRRIGLGGGLEPLRFLAGLLSLELLAAHAGAEAIRTPALTGVE